MESRIALLTSKRSIESRSRSNRDELLSSTSSGKDQVVSEKSSYVFCPTFYSPSYMSFSDDALMKANSDVTDALRRTIALMQTELERSVLTTQILDSSTASLRTTSLQHDTLSSVMSTSKQLITALEKADWLDRMLILSAFFFFLLVVLFIIKQRVVDKGLRIAFWWTRFFPDLSDDNALLKDAKKGIVGVSSLATTSLSLASSVSSVLAPGISVLPPNQNPVDETHVSSFSLSEPTPSSFNVETAETPMHHVEL